MTNEHSLLIGGRYLPWLGLGLLITAMLLSRKGRHAARRMRLESLQPQPPPPP